jgi:sugar phosphate isomerase/epimerase
MRSAGKWTRSWRKYSKPGKFSAGNRIQPGTIDFKRIFAAAGKSGMKHFFVEHDFPQDAEASINASSSYIRKMI